MPNHSKGRARLAHWFSTLAPGDRVRIRFPWNDKHTPGGHIEPAIVTRVRLGSKVPGMDPVKRVFFRYRLPWKANDKGLGPYVERILPQHDTYTHVLPLEHDVVYDPRVGYTLKRGQPKGGLRR